MHSDQMLADVNKPPVPRFAPLLTMKQKQATVDKWARYILQQRADQQERLHRVAITRPPDRPQRKGD